MWLIDLSSGVSATALLQLLLAAEPGHPAWLWQQLRQSAGSLQLLIPGLNKEPPALNCLIKAVQESLADTSVLDQADAAMGVGEYTPILAGIMLTAGEKALDPFSLFLYLSNIILLEKISINKNVFFTIPAVGPESPAITFRILQGRVFRIALGFVIMPGLLAALLKHYATSFINALTTEIREMVEVKDPCGPGACLRLFKGSDIPDNYAGDQIAVLETNIDDTTPELIAGAMEKILSEGALDYTVLPAVMKKNRLGFQIQILCNLADESRIIKQLFLWTTTFGIRRTLADRFKLHREIREMDTSLGKVRVKLGILNDKIIRISPEFDDIFSISKMTGNSTQNIYNTIYSELKNNID